MWWSKHGMGSQLMMNEHILTELLFDDKILEEIQELVMKGRRTTNIIVSDGSKR